MADRRDHWSALKRRSGALLRYTASVTRTTDPRAVAEPAAAISGPSTFAARREQLVLATRAPANYGDDLANWLQYGASPRATICLDRCARARAWLAGRDYVGPEDIQAVAYDVLRHRLILNYEAEAEGVTPDRVIGELIARIAVP